MKNITVTIMCAGKKEYSRSIDLLETCPGILILDRGGCLNEAGARMVLGYSDILILDETAIGSEGFAMVRDLHASHMALKILLVINKYSKINVISAFSMGFRGVVTRDAMVSELRKAVTAIHCGEAWMPRRLVKPLMDELVGMERMASWTKQSILLPGWDRMN